MTNAFFKGHILLSKMVSVRRSHQSGYPVDWHVRVKQPVLVTVSSANDDEPAREATK